MNRVSVSGIIEALRSPPLQAPSMRENLVIVGIILQRFDVLSYGGDGIRPLFRRSGSGS